MPKPPVKTEKTGPEVEVIPSETPQQKPAVEVEIDAKTGQPVEPSKPQVDTSSLAEELKKERARNEYMFRQFERQSRELSERLAQIQAYPQPVVPAEKPQSTESEFGPDLDAIAQQDWKKGVSVIAEKRAEQIAEKKFKTMMEAEQRKNQEVWRQQDYVMKLDRSRMSVVQRTPTLADETSEEFKSYYQVYNQMLQEDPNLLKNPYSPEIVENRWRVFVQQSNSPDKLEADRLKRVVGGAAPQSRPISTGTKTLKLTEDELELCKKRGISPAVYAQMKESNFKEGVVA